MNLEVFHAIWVFVFTASFAFLLGKSFLSLFKIKNNFVFCVGLGFLVLSYSMLILGNLKLIDVRSITIVSSIVFLILFFCNYKDMKDCYSKAYRKIYNISRFEKLLLTILFIYFTFIAIRALTPPISRDALNYHLLFPSLWLRHGSVFVIPENIYSFFPQFWEMIYLYLLVLGSDIAAKLMHLFALFLSIVLIYEIITKLFSNVKRETKLLVCLVFVSTPTVSIVSAWAYVDMALLLYMLLSLSFLLSYFTINKKRYLIFSAIFCGAAVSIKYLALIWIFFIIFLILEKKKPKDAFLLISAYLVIIFFLAAPYYLRNYIHTHNPSYPFLYKFFGGKFIDVEKNYSLNIFFKSFNSGRSVLDLILTPLKLSFFSSFENIKQFDGVLGVIYFYILTLFVFFHKKIVVYKSFFYFPVIYSLVWFMFSQQLRFLMPVIAIFLILSALILDQKKLKKSILIILLLAVSYLYYPINAILSERSHCFVSGKETRVEFLKTNMSFYPLIEKANLLPLNSKVMLLNLDPSAYYFHREFFQESVFEDYTFIKRLRRGGDSLNKFISDQKITHIIMNETRTEHHFKSHPDNRLFASYSYFKDNYLSVLDKHDDFFLYAINF